PTVHGASPGLERRGVEGRREVWTGLELSARAHRSLDDLIENGPKGHARYQVPHGNLDSAVWHEPDDHPPSGRLALQNPRPDAPLVAADCRCDIGPRGGQ